MGYFVLGENGQKYGPADIATLNQWITEGRISQHSVLEEEGSGNRVPAMSIAGLSIYSAAPPPQSPPMAYLPPPQFSSPYPRSTASGPSLQGVIGSILLALISPVCSFLFPIGGILTAGYGLRLGYRATQQGDARGWIGVGLSILALIFWLFTRITGFRYGFR